MFRSIGLRSIVAPLAAIAAVLLLATHQAALAEPFDPPNWRGDGLGTTAPSGGVDADDFVGKSTFVGSLTGEGFHILNPNDFTFAGQETWTAPDGAKLYVELSGHIFLSGDSDFPFGFIATLTAVGGTGRLAGATGEAVMTGAFTGVPGMFYYDFEGTLDLDHK
jgi:hypothetical protein